VQIGHRRTVIHEVKRHTALEQSIAPRLDRNVLKNDLAANYFPAQNGRLRGRAFPS
jgi:hypothetical protein